MDFDNTSIGIDIEEIERFQNKTLEKDRRFLEYIFTDNEINYCFSKKNPAPHLAARFCAKEATTKALYALNIEHITYKKIEIIKKENNMPKLIIKGYENLKTKVSLSHSKTNAIASVMIFKKN